MTPQPWTLGQEPLSIINGHLWVYPRVCGGTTFQTVSNVLEQGLSPRVRGNHIISHSFLSHLGSIPACAGEPTTCSLSVAATRVYPRVCGGTDLAAVVRGIQTGLSPRVRGNRARPVCPWAPRGSIPACAGEPRSSAALPTATSVYPRVCGGTISACAKSRMPSGLSPRVRGNLICGVLRRSFAGSIPACAGEPHCRAEQSACQGVYPRVCGGTTLSC